MPIPVTFWILTALADTRRHGYEILADTRRASAGRVTLKVATLYAALERMEQAGLIVADGEEIVAGRARRYYRITADGTAELTAEVDAMDRATAAARARLASAPRFSAGPAPA